MVDMDTPKAITLADLDELMISERFELIEGMIIPMSPAKQLHGLVAMNVAAILRAHVKAAKSGRILAAETGFRTRGDDKTLRAPDVVFISYQQVPAGELSPDFGRIPPELVVEVVSPNDRAAEIEEKTREWLTFGVSVVWVVYPETQRVHVYEQQGQIRILEATQEIDGGAVLPGFKAAISSFFED